MKRFSGLLKGSKNSPNATPSTSVYSIDESRSSSGDSPEASAARAVRLFCESGSNSNGDEEVLQLPTIVDSAESSPAAAAACAAQISTFLQKKYMSKPHVQYNAIMLIRILSDHPGEPFIRNFDDKFVRSVKTVLRECPDPSTQQILRETLDNFEQKGAGIYGGASLVQMWQKERVEPPPILPYDSRRDGGKSRILSFGKKNKTQSPAAASGAQRPPPAARPAPVRRPTLPPQAELASRVEEARNTAKILIQFLQTTPPEELAGNELVKEFNDRCQTAARSMQTFINSDNPEPDHDTMQTLIETNEQLSLASSRYQRAILAARRAHGSNAGLDAERAASNASPQIYQPVPKHPQNTTRTNDFAPQTNGLAPSPLLDAERQSSIGGFGSSAGPAHYPVQQPRYNQAPMIPSPPVSLLQDNQTRSHTHNNLSISSHAPSHDQFDDLYDSPDISRPRPADNPFADPVEPAQSQAPLAIEPLNYGQQSSRQDLENAYASTPTNTTTLNNLSPVSQGSPNSPPRPAIGPWHNSNITTSFLGRQESAINGLTMHAPGTPGATPAAIAEMDAGKDGKGVPASPSRQRRVDVAGTGGFRSA